VGRSGRQQYEDSLPNSLPITTNLGFAEWAEIFGDPKMTIALLDRLTHHCLTVETGNDSHRFKHSATVEAARESRTKKLSRS